MEQKENHNQQGDNQQRVATGVGVEGGSGVEWRLVQLLVNVFKIEISISGQADNVLQQLQLPQLSACNPQQQQQQRRQQQCNVHIVACLQLCYVDHRPNKL